MNAHDGELEERLRQHYQSAFGPSLEPAQIWDQIAQRMEQRVTGEIVERGFRGDSRLLREGQSSESQIGAYERPLRRTTGSSQRWRALLALAATLLVIALGGIVFGLLAAHRERPASPTETPSTKLPGLAYQIFGLQMLSDTNGWAIGEKGPYSTTQTGVILHFDGYRWSVVESLPNTLLNSLSMASAAQGWITGDTIRPSPTEQNGQSGTDVPFLLHYTGGKWLQQQSPLGLSAPSVTMVTVNFGWAIVTHYCDPASVSVGGCSASQHIAIYHNGVWTDTDFPTSAGFDAWFTSPANGWTTAGSSTFWHYTGGHWSQTPVIAPDGDSINDIQMTSPSNGWASGSDANGDFVLFHFNGVTLTQMPVPANQPQPQPQQNAWASLFVLSPTEFWLFEGPFPQTGSTGSAGSSSDENYLLHYVNGVWTHVMGPPTGFAGDGSVSIVSATDVWVGGSLATGGPGIYTAAIAHYAGGHWTLYS